MTAFRITEGYTTQGRDAQGRTVQGYAPDANGTLLDADGYDATGYDRIGYDRSGRDRVGQVHPFFTPDASGRYDDGLDAAGYAADGYGADGRDRWGFERQDYHQWGYDRNGYDTYGRVVSPQLLGGYDSAGFRIDPVTRERRDRFGFDASGYDAQGYRITGYDKHGRDHTGTERLTPHPKTDALVAAKYNRSGWDQSGYDRTGFHRATNLTAPDATGQRRNLWGWIYDEATNTVVNPADSTQRATHVAAGFDRYNSVTYYRAYTPPRPSTPITPHAPLTYAAFRATVPASVSDTTVRYEFDARHMSTVAARWQATRGRYDKEATQAGVRLRCPHCGQFTGGTGHACVAFGPPVASVLVYPSGVVKSVAGIFGIVATPHNAQYDPLYDSNGGYHTQTERDRQVYDRQGYSKEGRDRDGYTREGYDLFGYDRAGFDRRGYNAAKRDRAGTLRPRTVEDAAKGLNDGDDPINNTYLATLYSRIASTLRGQKRTVMFGADGSGFATDMQGTIYADPHPLGRDAPDAHNLVVIKGGIYHELAHEQFTPPAVWAAVLDIAKSPTPVAGLDAGRGLLPTMYNIIEDGGIERLLSRTYAGVAEVLAASCALQPRWGENVRPDQDTGGQVMGALLYTALPYYTLSDEVRAGMSPEARKLFAELEPVVAAAVRGTSDDRFRAAVHVTCRFEEEGLLRAPPPDMQITPPPPPPQTQPRTSPSGQQGQQGGHEQGQQDQQYKYSVN